MSLDSTPADKRKSLIIATLIYAVLLLIMFFIRFWPPSDAELALLAGGGGGGGVTVNFGDTDFGSGADFQSKELDVKEVSKNNEAQPTPDEDIISEDTDADKTDAVIPKTKPVKNPKPIVKPEIKKPVEVKKPVKKVDDALSNILKGNKKGGDGNSGTSGNQGRANGDINSSGYSGTGGSGGGTGGGNGTGNGSGSGGGSGSGSGGGNGSGNGKGVGAGYSLTGRSKLNNPILDTCGNETGLIVVKIAVDKNGNTISAEPGYKGTKITSNSSSCMLAAAKEAAIKTKWNMSEIGAEKQVGTVSYSFSLKN